MRSDPKHQPLPKHLLISHSASMLHNLKVTTDQESRMVSIDDLNKQIAEIDNQIDITHQSIRDKYRTKFPELESVVPHPTDYALVVKKIGNETDPSLVNLEGLLPSADIMVVSLIASTTIGKPLPDPTLRDTIDACDRLLALDSAKNHVLNLLETRMGHIAPNLSAIVGSAVAAKLVGAAGGLSELAKMPACDLKLLGAREKKEEEVAGFFASDRFRAGYIEQARIVQSTPPPLRDRACRQLASKSALAIRRDCFGEGGPDCYGPSVREGIVRKIEKWQERAPARGPKPLPVPAECGRKKKQRGGRRLRKMKERYGLTKERKRANMMQFGVAGQESLFA